MNSCRLRTYRRSLARLPSPLLDGATNRSGPPRGLKYGTRLCHTPGMRAPLTSNRSAAPFSPPEQPRSHCTEPATILLTIRVRGTLDATDINPNQLGIGVWTRIHYRRHRIRRWIHSRG